MLGSCMADRSGWEPAGTRPLARLDNPTRMASGCAHWSFDKEAPHALFRKLWKTRDYN